VIRVSDRAWLRERLLAHPALHLYELGDLDEFFWPHTTWYARGDAIALLYTAGEQPVVVALGHDHEGHAELLAELRNELPDRLYAHLSPGLIGSLLPRFADESYGPSSKMSLARPERLTDVDSSNVVALDPSDRNEAVAFYAHAYPGNWFDPRMLETGKYFAIRDGGAIVAAAGVHVYSRTERVAALGNIAVAIDSRGRGLGQRVTAAVCRSLLRDVDHVGLNVRDDNRAAIACYERLGFEVVAPYEEHLLTA
jgi:ribosomal protein S18 acetylase RimI-like enzyme